MLGSQSTVPFMKNVPAPAEPLSLAVMSVLMHVRSMACQFNKQALVTEIEKNRLNTTF